jgi:hypothetical protein
VVRFEFYVLRYTFFRKAANCFPAVPAYSFAGAAFIILFQGSGSCWLPGLLAIVI